MRWAVAALRLEGPPCRRRGRPAPRPFRPLQLGRPSPRSPQEGGGCLWGTPPPAGLGPLVRHLRPRRGAVADSQPNFGSGRCPLTPPRPRAGAPRPARMQMGGPCSQWPAGPGPPRRAAASEREAGGGRHAHRRAAPCGRGRRVPFRTSASGRGRHLPGGAWGPALPLPRRPGRVVRPEELSPPSPWWTAPLREPAGLRARSRSRGPGGAAASGRTYYPRLPHPPRSHLAGGAGALARSGLPLNPCGPAPRTPVLPVGPVTTEGSKSESAGSSLPLARSCRGTEKVINQEDGPLQTWSYRFLCGVPEWQLRDFGSAPFSSRFPLAGGSLKRNRVIWAPEGAERCLLPFCSWHRVLISPVPLPRSGSAPPFPPPLSYQSVTGARLEHWPSQETSLLAPGSSEGPLLSPLLRGPAPSASATLPPWLPSRPPALQLTTPLLVLLVPVTYLHPI